MSRDRRRRRNVVDPFEDVDNDSDDDQLRIDGIHHESDDDQPDSGEDHYHVV